MKLKTIYAERVVTTREAPEHVVRSSSEIAALVARYKPVAAAHARAKALAKASLTETSMLLENLRALTSKLGDQFAKKGD